MNTRVSFFTFGCRLNQSETASLANAFRQGGFDVVDIKDSCDIVVINTCTVTDGGDADTRRMVHKVNRLHPKARIALVGCQAQTQKERLAVLPGVSWIVGNERKMDLPKIFHDMPQAQKAHVVVPTINRQAFTMPFASTDDHHARANLKIQDGCDFFCSFCEIPFARGRARSRVFENIMAEAKALVDFGHREIVLTGINVGTFNHAGRSLLNVVEALGEIRDLKRVRISSIEPTTVDPGLYQHMISGKLCRYLHLPLQSGDDDILSSMSRQYNRAMYAGFVQEAFDKVDGICIGTDVIVGFPGETQSHFDNTHDLLLELPLHYFHVFSYSPRNLAKSRLLPPVPDSVITSRSKILRELSRRKRRLFYEGLLSQVVEVLWEEHAKGFWWGMTDNYVKVNIPSNKEDLRNRITPVRLHKAHELGIQGELA